MSKESIYSFSSIKRNTFLDLEFPIKGHMYHLGIRIAGYSVASSMAFEIKLDGAIGPYHGFRSYSINAQEKRVFSNSNNTESTYYEILAEALELYDEIIKLNEKVSTVDFDSDYYKLADEETEAFISGLNQLAKKYGLKNRYRRGVI